jgi:hypothetical protein
MDALNLPAFYDSRLGRCNRADNYRLARATVNTRAAACVSFEEMSTEFASYADAAEAVFV